jgi:anti-sigma factor RsiW
MADPAPELSERAIAELCALADGTLPAERRAAVEARVAASTELQELLDRQRRAVAATAALEREPVPDSLRTAVDTRRPTRRRASWLAPRLGLASGLAAVAVAVVVALSGEPGEPTVADAAQVATRPPTAPAPLGGSQTRLGVDVEGVEFPNLRSAYGWRAVGVRHDKIDGRQTTTVVYAKGRRRVGYAIVAGDGLSRPSGGRTTVLGGVPYQTVRLANRPGVTWRRAGHTCVLVGTAPRAELVRLASY